MIKNEIYEEYLKDRVSAKKRANSDEMLDYLLYEGNGHHYFRLKEYPPIEDFVDAWVKQDEEALEEYRAKCLEVKAKYPKAKK